jgi:succinate dehydrogenase/fumarate reductase flavoprotein subunit
VGSGSGERKYDLVVIGGGAAGFAAIVKYRELPGYDRKIAMITRGRFSADGGS